MGLVEAVRVGRRGAGLGFLPHHGGKEEGLHEISATYFQENGLSCFSRGGRCAWRSTAALPHRRPHLWLLLLASQRPQAIRSGSTSARHLASKRSTGRSFGKVSVCVYVVCAFMWCARLCDVLVRVC